MGAIPSISLPPIVTCAPGCTCAKDCYAAKTCRIYKNVKQSYENNLQALNENRDRYFSEISKACTNSRFFRYHVSGDILDADYFDRMVKTAEENTYTTFLCFTKKYNIVNEYTGAIPRNLVIIFSEWPGMDMENPKNFPIAHVIFKGESVPDEWALCPGNCLECAGAGAGCWNLQPGESVAFPKH